MGKLEQSGQEPVSGQEGAGNGVEPYDQGNNEGASIQLSLLSHTHSRHMLTQLQQSPPSAAKLPSTPTRPRTQRQM